MQFTRERLAETLRRVGRPELADEVLRSQPERVDQEEVAAFAARHGITIDMLISEMGGSP